MNDVMLGPPMNLNDQICINIKMRSLGYIGDNLEIFDIDQTFHRPLNLAEETDLLINDRKSIGLEVS